jgi:indoleamine 2,3-dioxygenase
VPSDFAVTGNGFLPSQVPLGRLSSPYYEQWENIASNLPQLVKTGQIRKKVRQLPLLCTANLHTEEEWRRAYVLLAFMTHGYIWGGTKPAEVCSSVDKEQNIL